MLRLAFVAVLIVAAACLDSHPPVCETPYKEPVMFAQRDPSTGECVTPQPTCNPSCGPCPGGAVEEPVDWAPCGGMCENLDEATCLVTPKCHAAYSDDPTPSPVFWGCWDMPPSGAIEGPCAGLDAQTCLEHDDCASLYTGPVNQPPSFVPSFESCQDKPAVSCAMTTCGTGDECVLTPANEAQCVPPATAGTCNAPVTCTIASPTCPSGSQPGIENGCYSGYCIPTTSC